VEWGGDQGPLVNEGALFACLGVPRVLSYATANGAVCLLSQDSFEEPRFDWANLRRNDDSAFLLSIWQKIMVSLAFSTKKNEMAILACSNSRGKFKKASTVRKYEFRIMHKINHRFACLF